MPTSATASDNAVSLTYALPPQVNDSHKSANEVKYVYPVRALRALGLLLADCAPTVGLGKTFCRVGRVPLTKTAVTQKRKVKKSIRRCQIHHNAEGYKRAIDKNSGYLRFFGKFPFSCSAGCFLAPIAQNGPYWGQ